jgi:phage terminase Nu1 subunit (DNA packaging protein)
MAEVIHRYVGKPGKPSKEDQRQKAAKQKLDAEFVREKTTQVVARRMQTEMEVARRRDLLIEKELVIQQASYLLVALRQRLLSMPQTYSRRLFGISDAKVMNAKLREMSLWDA